MFRFNLIGLGIFIIGGLLGLAISSLFGDDGNRTFGIAAFSAMIILDLLYRARNSASFGRAKWLGVKTGGFIALGPAWIMGVVMLVVFGTGLV